VELDNCLSAAEGEWWDNNDLCLAHTDEDWRDYIPNNTWYAEETILPVVDGILSRRT